MADTGIFATTEEVQRKVGANASSTANVESYINDFITQAESYINSVTRFNWSDNYAALNVDVKGLLKRAVSALATMDVINYDMSGFFTMAEAQTRLNFLSYEADQCIERLKDQEIKKFIIGA